MPNDPNYNARIHSERIWGGYMGTSKNVARWILTCNFFFGVLPGILFFATNVRISQETDDKITSVLPDFNRAVSWFGIIFCLFPLFVSVFQIFQFNRLISLRMTRTFFVGQLVGFVFYMCSFSKSFLKKFNWFPKKSTVFGLIVILMALSMTTVFIPYLFLFSEVVNYQLSPTYTDQCIVQTCVLRKLLQSKPKMA